ncbi:MAG: hypothetical protein JW894_04080 [Bacteroidales bacterium]|nr:hypothetical protein [Bacteroidales bacterium]
MKKLNLIVIALMLTAILFGQAPGKFKYQAVLRDVSGEILAVENVNIQISILQGSETGTQVFSETHSTTTNAYGMVNLGIGSINTTGLESIDWASGPYYISINVDGYEMGTSQLLSVPYALYAGNSSSGSCVWNKVGDNINYMDGNVSIKTGTTAGALNVGGIVFFEPGDLSYGSQIYLNAKSLDQGQGYSITSTAGDAMEGPGNFLIRNDTYEAYIIMDSIGRVGIGTQDNNWAKLNVNGVVMVKPGDRSYGSHLYLDAKELEKGDGYSIASTAGDALEGPSRFVIRNDAYSSFLIMDSIGRVGIGTFETGWAKLNVEGVTKINPGTTSYGSQLYLDAKALEQGQGYSITSTAGDAIEGPGRFLIRNDGYEAYIIMDSVGNVGIGTQDHNWAKLNVNGVVMVKPGDRTYGSHLYLDAKELDQGDGYSVASTAGDALEGPGKFVIRNDNYTASIIMDSTGNVGIGTTDPAAKLQVNDGDVYVETIGSGVILKSPDGNCWKITVNNSGALTTTPVTCP